jgi:hypothetical protein
VQYRIAAYTIYTGQNAGDQDAAISTLWLQVFGANAIGVTGPGSTEVFKPFVNWKKFDGFLDELWRHGDNVIYRVPRRSVDPVRVIPENSLLTVAPENGLDVGGLRKFVSALEDPEMPEAHFRWTNRHEAIVEAQAEAGQLVYLQLNHDSGWRAFQGTTELTILSDPMGMMYVRPSLSAVPIRLQYTNSIGSPSLGWALSVLGTLTLLALVRKQVHHSSR